jgi:centromere protein J
MKSKETRWVANNNRLKERIELLELEKAELKNELKIIEKFRIKSIMGTQDMKEFELIDNLANQRKKYNIIPDFLNDSNNSFNKSTIITDLNEINETKLNLKNGENLDSYLTTTTNSSNLKRSTSDKSLSSSNCSSFSSISIGSTNSAGNHLNLKNQSTKASNLNSKFSIDQDIKAVSKKIASNLELSMTKLESSSPLPKRNNEIVSSILSTKSFDSEGKISCEEQNCKIVKFKIDIAETSLKDKFEIKDKKNDENSDSYLNQKYIEKILDDGSVQTVFRNGTIKEVTADKKHTIVRFFNGDRKEINHQTNTETYYYAETKITQIIHSNGFQILKFPNGQIENHHVDKTKEIIFPDKIKKIIFQNGTEESYLPNGTIIKVNDKGEKIIEYPNKQREIHTKEFKRREYPDGSVKTVYSNGISETVYSNGRIRIKDSLGNLIN